MAVPRLSRGARGLFVQEARQHVSHQVCKIRVTRGDAIMLLLVPLGTAQHAASAECKDVQGAIWWIVSNTPTAEEGPAASEPSAAVGASASGVMGRMPEAMPAYLRYSL